MEKKVINKDKYELHLLNIKKFNTTLVKIVIEEDINKEALTKKNLLYMLLGRGSKKYPTLRENKIMNEELYAPNIKIFGSIDNNLYKTTIIMDILNDKFTEEGNLEKTIKHYLNCFFDPNIKDNKFDDNELEIVKNKLYTILLNEEETPSIYSKRRALEEFDPNLIGLRGPGYIYEINSITSTELYNIYLELINNSKIKIYVVGDLKEDITKVFEEVISFKNSKKDLKLEIIEKPKVNEIVKEVVEEKDLEQSIVRMIGLFKNPTDYERRYVAPLLNIILGGIDFKLFNTVREEHSLCYTIHSSYTYVQNLFEIAASISSENYKKTKELIYQEIENIKNGKITDIELESAKNKIVNSENKLSEKLTNILADYLLVQDLGYKEKKERMKLNSKVTKEEIANLMKKLQIDTIYLLKGEKND